jgi:hypothetical protein
MDLLNIRWSIRSLVNSSALSCVFCHIEKYDITKAAILKTISYQYIIITVHYVSFQRTVSRDAISIFIQVLTRAAQLPPGISIPKLPNFLSLGFRFFPLNMRLTFYPNHNTTLYYTMLLIITSIYGGNKKYGSRERK